MGNCKHLDHAKHNEQVCNHLNNHNGFSDWVITTAFYSATHYVRNKIIPFVKKGSKGNKRFTDFESLYNSDRVGSMGRHEYTIYHLSKHHPQIQKDFRILKDLANTARYINYQMGAETANNARTLMRDIRDYCTQKK